MLARDGERAYLGAEDPVLGRQVLIFLHAESQSIESARRELARPLPRAVPATKRQLLLLRFGIQ